VTRPPRPLLAVAVLLAALCVLGSAAVGRSTAAGVRTAAVPLPSTPMRGADAREVDKAATATWKKIRGTKSAPGLWVGVWDPRRGYWEGAFGKATRGGPAATTKDHLRIGSITKTFTATVVLGLVAEGKLALRGTVGRYDAELAREFPPLRKITIEELLAMRSGIPDYLNVPGGVIKGIFEAPRRVWTPGELIAGAMDEKVEKPGTPGYSTTNYIVLQLIAEAVSGDSLEGLIAERVTGPLGLNGTALGAPAQVRLPSPRSGGYVGEAGAREFREFGAAAAKPGTDVTDWSPSWAQGGGGMYSTLHDLGVWAASGVGNALLPKWLAAKRFATRPTPFGEYGLGVQRLGDLYGHTGETFGAETFALNDAKTGVTFVIAANQTSALGHRFLDLLFRLYPGERP
jgi:D-alanyl-D-alanine carboxypeptidase